MTADNPISRCSICTVLVSRRVGIWAYTNRPHYESLLGQSNHVNTRRNLWYDVAVLRGVVGRKTCVFFSFE